MYDQTEQQKRKRAKTHEIRLLCLGLAGNILGRRWDADGCSTTGGAVIRLRRTSEARGGNTGRPGCVCYCWLIGAIPSRRCPFCAACAWRDMTAGAAPPGTGFCTAAAVVPPAERSGGAAAAASKRNFTGPSSVPFESTTSAILWIRSFMYRDQAEIIRIGIRSNLLHFVSLCILNKDHVFTAVVEPAQQDKFIEHFWLCPHGHRRHDREWISLPDLLIAVGIIADRNVVRSRGNPATDR